MTYARVSLATLLILVLALTGCGSAVNDLQVALDAITTAFPLIAGLTGVPAATTAEVVNYLDAANNALDQASTILAGPGTDAQKTAQIVAAFAAVVAPVVPSQYSALASLVQAIAGDVAKFLAGLPATTSTGTTTLSQVDRNKLAHASTVAGSNRVALRKLKKP